MREPGASPGRSRRCEGSSSPAETPLARRVTGRREGGGRGSPESEDLPLSSIPNPSWKEDSWLGVFFVVGAALGLALVLAASTLAASVTVRVEGKTQPIFGSVPVKVDASNAMVALDAASLLGEFYFQVTQTSFGPYVSQIGRYPGAGTAGWVFKVNGASPPVGADQVHAERRGRGALVLRDVRSDTGGPKTLSLKATTGNCYTVSSFDDAGKSTAAAGAQVKIDGRRIKAGSDGKACVGRHIGLVRAYAVGAVRSNAAK